MVKKIIGVSAASFAIAASIAVATAPAASAEGYCGLSTRGAEVYSGNSVTSCGFALNTVNTYHGVSGSQPFNVFSPVTGQTYTMRCYGARGVCEGGNNALVYFQ